MTALIGRQHPISSFLRHASRLPKVSRPLLDATKNTAGLFYTAAKARISRGLSVDLYTSVEPNFESFVETFLQSREAFERAEDMFWKLRVQCEEQKALITAQAEVIKLLEEQIELLKANE